MNDPSPHFIPQEIIDRIKERADIIQLLTPFVNLRKAGKNFMAPCPFHQETKPSFTVNPVMQYFYCFGCGAKGNVFSFFMQYNNLSFPDAVTFVADRIGFVIPKQLTTETIVDRRKKEESERLIEINDATAQYFSRLLAHGQRGKVGRDYLHKRGLKQETIDEFRIGLAPPPWDELHTFLLKKGFAQADLAKTGLFIHKEDSASTYDRFRQRIMFPLFRPGGQIVGFAGRILQGDEAKYMNSPETVLYQKRKMLYGLHQGGDAIRKERSVLIVEGYFDLLSLYQEGIKNVVATCGTALTDDHIHLLRRYSRTINLVFDSDQAGITAALRSLEMLIERDLELTVCPLAGNKDPDEFIRQNGREAFLQLMQKGLKPFSFIFEYTRRGRTLTEADETMAYLNEITPYILKISDPIKQSLIIKQAAEYIRVDQRELFQRFRQQLRSGKKGASSKNMTPPPQTDCEADLLTLLLHNPLKIERYREEIARMVFKNAHMEELFKLILSVWEQEKITKPDQWLDKWGILPQKDNLITLCMMPVIDSNIDDQIQGWLLKTRIKTLEKKRQECFKALQHAEKQDDPELLSKISRDIMTITGQLEELHHQIK